MLFPKQLRMQCQLGTLVLAPLLGSQILVTITGSSLPLGLCSNNAITVKVPGAIVVERVRVSLHKDGGITILIVVLPNQSKELMVDLPEVVVIGVWISWVIIGTQPNDMVAPPCPGLGGIEVEPLVTSANKFTTIVGVLPTEPRTLAN